MINDLLITTTDTYRYLCFALFNILLLLSFAVTNNDSFAIVLIKDQFLFYLVCVCKYENRFASIWLHVCVCVFIFVLRPYSRKGGFLIIDIRVLI